MSCSSAAPSASLSARHSYSSAASSCPPARLQPASSKPSREQAAAQNSLTLNRYELRRSLAGCSAWRRSRIPHSRASLAPACSKDFPEKAPQNSRVLNRVLSISGDGDDVDLRRSLGSPAALRRKRIPHRARASPAPACSKGFPEKAPQNSRVLNRVLSISGAGDDDDLRRSLGSPDALRRKRIPHRARAARGSAPVEGSGYEFCEDGPELEVRVPLPSVEDAGRVLTARYVAVDAQATSLVVGVETVHGVQILLNATALYASIKPSETVWFVDETEVVLSLKKADYELSWPDLVEAWESLAKGVSTLLKGTSVYVVGESSEVNWAVAQELAAGLEYVPLHTQQLIERIAGASVEEILMEEGNDAIEVIEGAVLSNLSQRVRNVVATIGGSEGSAARYGGWNGLHAGFSVWLSQTQAQDEESAKEEAVRAKEARSQAYSNADVVVAITGWDSTAVRPTAEGALRALKCFLMTEKDLPGKKSLYVRLGCRGDWPEIMPPGWDPASPQDEEKQAQSIAV